MTKMLPFATLKRCFTALTLSALLALNSACSMSMFGDAKDKDVKETKTYRKINPACAHTDLSSPVIDAKTFKGLLGCLNSNGALDPLNRLVQSLTDEQLQPLVDATNRYILENRQLLFQLDETHRTLKETGIADDTYLALGKLIENEEFISSAIALLKEGYFSPGARTADKSLLKGLERIATKITDANTEDAIDAGLTVAGSNSFAELQAKLKSGAPSRRSLRDITDPLLAHLKDSDPGHVSIGYEFLSKAQSQELFQLLDDLLGRSPEELRQRTAGLSAAFSILYANSGTIMDGLTTLVHYSQSPLPCVDGGVVLSNPALFMLSELVSRPSQSAADFIKRDNLLDLATLNSFCSYPRQIADHYHSLMALADTTAIVPTVDMTKAFYARPGMLDLLMRLMADTGNGPFPAEDTSGIKRLTPLLAEVTDRGAWEDVFLVLSLLPIEQRQRVTDSLKFLMEPAPELNDKSLYQVFTNVALRTSPANFYNFISSLRRFTDSHEAILAPALKQLRSAYYVNDVHPLVSLAHDLLAEASRNEALFNTLFEISDKPEFKDTIRMFSDMAKDGQMKELLDALFTIFHKFAVDGTMEIHRGTEPAFEPKRRHNLIQADLEPFRIAPMPTSATAACFAVDIGVKLSDTGSSDYSSQIQNLLSCRTGGAEDELMRSIQYLQNTTVSDNKTPALNFVINLFKKLAPDQDNGLTGPEMHYMMQAWARSMDDGRFYRLLDVIPFWVTEKFGGSSVIEPALELLKPIMNEGQQKRQRLETFVANEVLKREDFPALLTYTRKIGNAELAELREQPAANIIYDPETIATAARACENAPNPNQRAQEIIADYESNLTNWTGPAPQAMGVAGSGRRQWSVSEFRTYSDDILNKIADPSQNNPQKNLLKALLDFMTFFTLPEAQTESTQKAHYHKGDLLKWFKDRSNDHKLISYMENGKVRVRLANTLDQMELILINADMVAPILNRNFGLQFTAQIANAWGDDKDSSVWPQEIQNQFSPNKNPPETLEEAVANIRKTHRLFSRLLRVKKGHEPCLSPRLLRWEPAFEQTDDDGDEVAPEHEWVSILRELGVSGEDMGDALREMKNLKKYPNLKQMRAALYNLNQVLDVLEEDLPGKRSPGNPGIKVLRDLFYELYYSTPDSKKSRGPKGGWNNNLSVAMRLVKMGIARQAGRILAPFAADDKSVEDAFSALVEGATSNRIESILTTLIVTEKDRKLLWNAITELFAIYEKATDPEKAAMQQLAHYFLAAGHQLKIIDPALAAAERILPPYMDFLEAHVDKLRPVLTSTSTSKFVRALYEDADQQMKASVAEIITKGLCRPLPNGTCDTQLSDDGISIIKSVATAPAASTAWDQLSQSMDLLLASAEYQHLDVSGALRPILDFFEEHPDGAGSAEAAKKIRLWIVDRLLSPDPDRMSDLDELLSMAAKDPARFHQVLETLSHSIGAGPGQSGELKDLLQLIRRGLSQSS